jgi:hypothetical protein
VPPDKAPFAQVHVVQPWRTARSPGDLTIRWTRRSRALVTATYGMGDRGDNNRRHQGHEPRQRGRNRLDHGRQHRPGNGGGGGTTVVSTLNVTFASIVQAGMPLAIGAGPGRKGHQSARETRGKPVPTDTVMPGFSSAANFVEWSRGLPGTQTPSFNVADLIAVGLQVGKNDGLWIFYAERYTTRPTFNMATLLPLEPLASVPLSAPGLLLSGGFGLLTAVRRKQA